MYSRSESSFCVELSSGRVGGCRVGSPPFIGVKFTGDYRSVAITPTLFRDHRQKSKKPNFSSFFRLLTRNNYVIPK